MRIYIVLVILMLSVPMAQAGLFSPFAKFLARESNMVGHAYEGFAKCSAVREKAHYAKTVIDDSCPRLRQRCSRYKTLLGRYEGYLSNYCDVGRCVEGAKRCRTSVSGTTDWVETCSHGSWVQGDYCYEGCNNGRCASEIIDFRITPHPDTILPGRSSVLVVQVYHQNGLPAVNAPVEVSADHGVLIPRSGVTDEYGQFLLTYLGSRIGYAMITAQVNVGDMELRDSDYVRISYGS